MRIHRRAIVLCLAAAVACGGRLAAEDSPMDAGAVIEAAAIVDAAPTEDATMPQPFGGGVGLGGGADFVLSAPPGVVPSSINGTFTLAHGASVVATGYLPVAATFPLDYPFNGFAAGKNYVFNAYLTDADGDSCTGSATFDVEARELTPVPVTLVCSHDAAANDGS
jgi:hypothetical protein